MRRDGSKEGSDCRQKRLSGHLFEGVHCQENTADLQGKEQIMKMSTRDRDTESRD